MLHKDACNIINSQKAEIINLRNIQEKQADIIAEINAQKYEQAYVIDCLKAEIKKLQR